MHIGGSTALVASTMLTNAAKIIVITFNAPRAGDSEFVRMLRSTEINHIRVRTGGDVFAEAFPRTCIGGIDYRFDKRALYVGKPQCWDVVIAKLCAFINVFSSTHKSSSQVRVSILHQVLLYIEHVDALQIGGAHKFLSSTSCIEMQPLALNGIQNEKELTEDYVDVCIKSLEC